MTYQALLCAITANNGRRFILDEDEVNRLVTEYCAETLLEDSNLFWEAVRRLFKDKIPHGVMLRRLVAIFGCRRMERFLDENSAVACR